MNYSHAFLVLTALMLAVTIVDSSAFSIRTKKGRGADTIPVRKVNAILTKIDSMLDTLRHDVAVLRDVAAGSAISDISEIKNDNLKEERTRKKRPTNKWRKYKNQRKRDYDIPFPFHGGFGGHGDY